MTRVRFIIDARDAVGTPVITDCAAVVSAFGVTYLVPADARSFRAGPITFEATETESLTDRIRAHMPYTVTPPGVGPFGPVVS